MSLPVKTKTWQYNVNQAVGGTLAATTDRKAVALAIKNGLKGFATLPWTVVGSSNGVAAGMDAVDRWASASDLVAAARGSAHSWIVLKQTGIAANFQMLLSFGTNNGSGSLNYCQIAYSPSAGFTGGSTTADPTATDELWMGDGSTSVKPALAQQDNPFMDFGNSTPFSGKLHMMQSTDGQCTRVVLMVSAGCRLCWIIDKPGSPVSPGVNWAVPFVAMNQGEPQDSQGANPGGLTAYSYLFRGNTTLARFGTRAGATPAACGMFMTTECQNQSELGTNQNFANDLDGTWPLNAVGMYCNAGSGVRGRHGVFQDLWCGASSNRNSAYPADASRQFAQFGDLVFPWNGSVPLFS